MLNRFKFERFEFVQVCDQDKVSFLNRTNLQWIFILDEGSQLTGKCQKGPSSSVIAVIIVGSILTLILSIILCIVLRYCGDRSERSSHQSIPQTDP